MPAEKRRRQGRLRKLTPAERVKRQERRERLNPERELRKLEMRETRKAATFAGALVPGGIPAGTRVSSHAGQLVLRRRKLPKHWFSKARLDWMGA